MPPQHLTHFIVVGAGAADVRPVQVPGEDVFPQLANYDYLGESATQALLLGQDP